MSFKKAGENLKRGWKKFWFLLWKDNSLKGWAFSLIFLFVFIKFIFFPGLNLVTGTTLPLAIVESCSMYHQGNVFSNFNNWFERHESKYQDLDISKTTFEHFIFRRGFSKGDILFLIKANPDKLKIGDIIAFSSGTKNTPVIHRIVEIERKVDGQGNVSVLTFKTIGDNNDAVLIPGNNDGEVDEREIKEEQLVGKAVFRVVPYLGWAKLIFFEHSRNPEDRGLCETKGES